MKGGHSTARSKTRVALGAATAAGVVAAVVGFSGADAASAHPVSLALNYTCSVFVFSKPVLMEIHSDLPDSVAVGRSSPESALSATTTVTKDETHMIHSLLGQLKSVEGTVDANTEWHSPEGDLHVPVHFRIKKAAIPESDRAFTLTAKGTAPSRTFHQPGSVHISVGNLTMKLVGHKANGQSLGTVGAACKLDAHPQPVVASFEVTRSGKTTAPPASGTSGAGGTTGSASAGASARPASTADGAARDTMANTGQDTKDLTLLAVGALAAGGGLLLHGSRLKRRRRAGR